MNDKEGLANRIALWRSLVDMGDRSSSASFPATRRHSADDGVSPSRTVHRAVCSAPMNRGPVHPPPAVAPPSHRWMFVRAPQLMQPPESEGYTPCEAAGKGEGGGSGGIFLLPVLRPYVGRSGGAAPHGVPQPLPDHSGDAGHLHQKNARLEHLTMKRAATDKNTAWLAKQQARAVHRIADNISSSYEKGSYDSNDTPIHLLLVFSYL